MNGYKEALHKILFIYVNRLIKQLSTCTDSFITVSMFNYLDAIYVAEIISPSLLAEKVGVSRAASSKMIKKLLELGYVKKNNIAKPRCPYTVSLTDKAMEIYKISNRQDKELIDLMDKHIDMHNIININKKLQSLLKEYEEIDNVK